MKKSFITFVTIIVISGCGSTPKYTACTNAEIKSDYQVDQKELVFGVPLGKPITINECPKKIFPAFADYSNSDDICFKRIFDTTSCRPLKSENVFIAVPYADRPSWVMDIKAQIVDGIVQGFYINTFGINAQSSVMDGLSKKYGKPSFRKENIVQNGVGDQFRSIFALWDLGNVQITFSGTYGKLNQGLVSIQTPVGVEEEKKLLDGMSNSRGKL